MLYTCYEQKNNLHSKAVTILELTVHSQLLQNYSSPESQKTVKGQLKEFSTLYIVYNRVPYLEARTEAGDGRLLETVLERQR